jgi:O-antigen/teichoic acid export membrane protein
LQILATAAFAWIMPKLIVWLYGTAFVAAVPFALWLLPASAIKGYLQAADGYLKGRGKPMIGVWSRAISILVMLAFVAATFSRFGLLSVPIAAGVGQAISMAIISIVIMLDVRQQQSEKLAEQASNLREGR